ncbi:MAG TPA: inorganic phosphate transporter, partial [Methanoregula sp.]|nr:inorganic phosphate transporter [Methanoregula sp.]
MIGFEPLILFGIILALALNFVNGLNDASHSIATVVATKALSPAKAVFFTALCNLIGPFLFTTAVAATIGTAIVASDALTPLSIVVAMGAAIILVFVATRSGIPISSSHAMVGGLLGAGIAVTGMSAVILPAWTGVMEVLVYGIAGALIGAVALGLFVASFHEDARFGAMLGALCGVSLVIPVMMVLGLIQIGGLLAIVLFIFISPVLGMAGAFVFDVFISHLF